MNIWEAIVTALNQRLVVHPPFDVYWFIGMAIVLASVVLVALFILKSHRG